MPISSSWSDVISNGSLAAYRSHIYSADTLSVSKYGQRIDLDFLEPAAIFQVEIGKSRDRPT